MAQAVRRVARWLGQRWCGFWGQHFYLVTRDGTRVFLVCGACGHATAGWQLARED